MQKKLFALAEAHLDDAYREVRNLATALFIHFQRLFTFLEVEGVEPTNNVAERILRLTQTWFNEQIESNNRATLLSFRSTFDTMGGAAGLLFAGRIADTAGIPFEWQIAGLISVCAAPLYWAIKPVMSRAAITVAAK